MAVYYVVDSDSHTESDKILVQAGSDTRTSVAANLKGNMVEYGIVQFVSVQ